MSQTHRTPGQPFRNRKFNANLQELERRDVPSFANINYDPPSIFYFDETYRPVETRSPVSDPLRIALDHLSAHRSKFGLTEADIASAAISDNYVDVDSGFTRLYLKQTFNGLDVANALINFSIAPNGQVLSGGGGFVQNLDSQMTGSTITPVFSPIDAVHWAAAAMDDDANIRPNTGCSCLICAQSVAEYRALPAAEQPQVLMASNAPNREATVIAKLSADPIPAQLQYVPTPDGAATLAWRLIVRMPTENRWYEMSVEDGTGRIVSIQDYVNDAKYRVVPFPNESPQDGGFAVLTDPWTSPSPFGWHDNNGVSGPEFTDTRGNNVDAHLDLNNDNVADTPRPSGGVDLDFSTFVFDPTQAPSAQVNRDAAVVNLFYANNRVHDLLYAYGFTEVAGNFQTNNYGKGGLGNDAVQADAQDGGGTNNANMSTPHDGSAPRMQMYVWTAANPDRDSSLDNGVIAHEYGHGLSFRLTGGPSAGALSAVQSGGMGEGWSDFLALMFTQTAAHSQNSGYGIGTYLLNQPQTGVGIRRFRYAFNTPGVSGSLNPLTFEAYGSSGTTSYGVSKSTQVHNTGELWCSALWDLNWLLINKYGYDSNLDTGYTGSGSAGNKLALKLVVDAMKIHPSNPSFIQARDAILAADTALTGGANHFEIWTAFARRGLGQGATTSSSSSTTLTTSFVVPPSLIPDLTITGVTPADSSTVSTPPTSFIVQTSNSINPATLQASDFKVNGIAATAFSYTTNSHKISFTFSTSPVTTQGQQLIAIDAGAFQSVVGSKDVLAFSSKFRYDALPMQVVSTTPTVGSTIAPPLVTFDLNLNEPVAPASVAVDDLVISQGTVSSFELLNGDSTVRFTLAGVTSTGSFTASLPEGAFNDVFGNKSLAFSGNYTLATPTFSVTGITINGGDPQRSRITEITIAFNTAADAAQFQAPNAITLKRLGATLTGGIADFVVDSGNGLIISPTSGLTNSITLTFANIANNGVERQSLADGRWELSVTPAGYVSSDATTPIRRIFGDANGDGTVDATDFSLFGSAFGLPGSLFDSNADNVIDGIDFASFGARIGLTI